MATPPTLPPGWKQIPTQTNSKVGIAYSTTVPDPNNLGKNLTLYAITKNNNITEYKVYDSNKKEIFNKTQSGDPLPAPGSNLSVDDQNKLITLATTQTTTLATSLGGNPIPPPLPGFKGPTANTGFGLPDKLPFEFGAVDTAIKQKPNKPLNYPEDALYTKTQDHLSIAQYGYKPPRRDDIFGDALNTLQNGSKRTSPLKELLGMVNLPMPNNITDSNNVSWADDNMNNLSAALTSYVAKNTLTAAGGSLALNSLLQTIGAGGATKTASLIATLGAIGVNPGSMPPQMQTLLGGVVSSQVLSMLGVSVSPESILARGYGIVPNSNLELLFNGPTLREFTFQYRKSPRSSSEAKIINNIIRFFKQGMAAKKISSISGGGSAGAQSYFLGTPNVFQLQYKTTGGKTIKGVNRIKTCALTGFAMNYAADGNWAAYDEGQPVSVIMNMSFKELEPVYDTDYQSNVEPGRLYVEGKSDTGDLYPISDDEVGY